MGRSSYWYSTLGLLGVARMFYTGVGGGGGTKCRIETLKPIEGRKEIRNETDLFLN